MSDSSVSERRIRPIQDAVASGNWKQALSLCDKWQKKGEKSDRFLALKASILVNQQDKSQIEKGKAETLQLCRRNVPITDVEALHNLQDTLKRLSLQNEEGPKLWDRAASALPNDKEFLTTWLNGSLADSNWLMAQKAATALRKAFPKERQYDFLNILLCYLIHQDISLPEKERNLFGLLAYRLVSKAAEAVPTDKAELISPGKAISTPDELALLTKIYQNTDHVDEAVTLLQSDNLGLSSKVAESDPQMVFSQLLEAFSSSTKSIVVLNSCKRILAPDSPQSDVRAEDDRIWKTVVHVAVNKEYNLQESCLGLIHSVLERLPQCRAAHLANLEILAHNVSREKSSSDDLVTSCQNYYDIFQTKPFCFADLVKPLHTSGTEYVQKYINMSTSEESSEAQKVFGLKLQHSILSEQTSTDADFLDFVVAAVRLHKALPSHKIECPETLVLAALSLLRIAARSSNITYAIQAAFMLQYTLSKFGEYYPSAIRLIQTHRMLGLLSLAMDTFVTLSVKNIQWETVGHLILTRISSIHPMQSGRGESALNPLGAFDAGLNMLDKAERSIDQAIKQGLEHGSYANVLDSVGVKHDIDHSLNRQIFAVEERKIHAIIEVPIDIVLEPRPAKMVDTRDFGFLDDYGSSNQDLTKYLQCGPLPGEFWLDVMMLCDHIITGLKTELSGQHATAAQAFDAMKRNKIKIESISKDKKSHLTSAECSSLMCHFDIADIIATVTDPASRKESNIDAMLERIQSWLKQNTLSSAASVNGVEVPTWEYLHTCFSRLETIQMIALLSSYLVRKTKLAKPGKGVLIPKDKVAELQKEVLTAEKAIHSRTKELKAAIDAPGVLGKLIDAAAGRIEEGELGENDEYKTVCNELADLYDEVMLEEYCGKMKDSWEDALDGIMQVKIKTPK